MGKQFTIENNEIRGLEFDLGFSSRSNAGTDRNVNATWVFDGMSSEEAAELLWAAFKVVVQRTTLKKASDAEIARMKGQRLFAKDYLKAEAGGRARELERQLEAEREPGIPAPSASAGGGARGGVPRHAFRGDRGEVLDGCGGEVPVMAAMERRHRSP